ncbi:MAG: winged helix DNA-binding domain-containing protein [Polyangiales bacterium]
MKARDLGRQRLMNLHIAGSRCTTPTEAVAALGAMQAQDYQGALWAIGLRVPGCTLADVERAVEAREIVRSWPLRGTLHFVHAADLGWMLDLLSERVLRAVVRRQGELGLDAATLKKVEKLLAKELTEPRTRDALRESFTRAKISPDGGRLYHCLLHFALHQQICFALPDGKQPTFVLLDSWIPQRKRLSKEQALSELTTRYFTSHGPATQQDLMRWAGLTAAEAKQGIASAKALRELDIEGRRYWTAAEEPTPNAATKGTFLLPGFDEFILGYRDRDAILDSEHASKIVPGANGVFRPTIVHGGKVLGTWKASASKKAVTLTPTGFATRSASEERAFSNAGKLYAQFLGKALQKPT